ncbi:hypothetical protein CLOP_g9107 [Closterium sp. NIES-67]|nr:hypothetical protein CLOP_g9107 [Closterium sp. NIES-67]
MDPVVVDCGSGTFKAGYANPDADPPVIVPNRFVAAPGESPATNGVGDSNSGEGGGRVVVGVERGRVVDWGVMEDAWRYMLYEQIGWEEGGEGAVLLCEPILTPRADREQAAQILFESFSCAGFFAAEQPVLALYALGRLSGCCVDLGHGKTDFSVVQEGALVPSSARRWPIGGSDLSERIQRLVLEERQRGGGAERGEGEEERGLLTGGGLSLDAVALERLKEEACEAALDENSFAAARAVEERKEFVLPDGQRISLGPERWDIAEALFRPSLLTHSPLSPPSLEASSLAGPDSAGIVRQLLSVVMDGAGLGGGGGGGGALGGGMGGVGGGGGLGGGAGGMGLEGGKQRAALESIAVVGGGSSLKGLLDRFQSEVQMALPPSLQPTVVRAPEYMPDNTACYAAWYGGAIVARIVFSQNQHVTRAEYNERGPAAVHRKSM